MSFDSEAQHLLKRARVLSERAHAYSAKYSMDADTISSEILSLHTAIREYLKATPNDAVARQAERVIKGHEGPGGDLRRLLPLKHRRPVSFFVRMFTGDRLKLHMVAPEDAQAFKEEYHRFRDATAIFFTLYPALVLALDLATGGTFHPRDLFTVPPAAVPPGPPPSPLVTLACQVLVAAMLYFYVALSIREGILQVNGSNVRAWWIMHHYISIGALLVLLTMRIEALTFFGHFLFMIFQQGLVMLLYNRFQRRRMYTRIALGKASPMEVVGGESSGTSGQLKLLYPLLFFLQAYQVHVGASLVLLHREIMLSARGWLRAAEDQTAVVNGRGSFFLGTIFVVLGLGNLYNTFITLVQKRRAAGRAAKSVIASNSKKAT